ncbi:hypothetical protein [Streptomyces sp. NPDC003635]
MSSDFGFWKRSAGNPEEVFDNLAEGETSNLVASPEVLCFRHELMTRWPDLADVLEPSRFDLEEEPDDVEKYVLLTLSVSQLEYLPQILEVAKRNGLVGFSGVAGEPI